MLLCPETSLNKSERRVNLKLAQSGQVLLTIVCPRRIFLKTIATAL